MKKFLTRDEKVVKVKVDPKNTALMEKLVNSISRLSYDEILDGELEKRLGDSMSEIEIDLEKRLEESGKNIGPIEPSSIEDIKDVLLSKAIFDSISKPMGT